MHECTPPATPQYNRVADKALSVTHPKKDNRNARRLKTGHSERLREEAMNMATDVTNISVTAKTNNMVFRRTSTKSGIKIRS